MTTRASVRLAAVAAALAAAGCGGDTARISGRVVHNGQPYPFEPGERLELTFYRAAVEKESPPLALPADVNPDGTFVVEFGRDDPAVPPGAYKIGAVAKVYDPGAGDPKKRKFELEFAKATTPLAVEVAAGEKAELVIDLGAKTVRK